MIRKITRLSDFLTYRDIAFYALWVVSTSMSIALVSYLHGFRGLSDGLYPYVLLMAVGMVQGCIISTRTKSLIGWMTVSILGGIACGLVGSATSLFLLVFTGKEVYSTLIGASLGAAILGLAQSWSLRKHFKSWLLPFINLIAISSAVLYVLTAIANFSSVLFSKDGFPPIWVINVATIGGLVFSSIQGLGLLYIFHFSKNKESTVSDSHSELKIEDAKFYPFNRKARRRFLLFLFTIFIFGLFNISGQTQKKFTFDPILLGATLPDGARNIGYSYEHAASGPQSIFCAKVSEDSFAKYVDEINEIYDEVGKAGGLSAASVFRDINSAPQPLSCWTYDEAAPAERHTLDFDSDSAIIAYQNGVMYVVRVSR